ncbi:MAG: hypothetical protein ACKO2V_06825 [Snowella sp.]
MNKVEAFERFVNLNVIALGLLQILALELPQGIWANFPRWFRTLPSHGYPSERVVSLAIHHQAQRIFPQSQPSLLLPKFLSAKLASSPNPDMPTLAA